MTTDRSANVLIHDQTSAKIKYALVLHAYSDVADKRSSIWYQPDDFTDVPGMRITDTRPIAYETGNTGHDWWHVYWVTEALDLYHTNPHNLRGLVEFIPSAVTGIFDGIAKRLHLDIVAKVLFQELNTLSLGRREEIGTMLINSNQAIGATNVLTIGPKIVDATNWLDKHPKEAADAVLTVVNFLADLRGAKDDPINSEAGILSALTLIAQNHLKSFETPGFKQYFLRKSDDDQNVMITISDDEVSFLSPSGQATTGIAQIDSLLT